MWEQLVALLLAVVFCIYSGLVLSHVIRSEYRVSGQCRCGYDIRGNRSGRCPECGEDIPTGSQEHGMQEKAARQQGTHVTGEQEPGEHGLGRRS